MGLDDSVPAFGVRVVIVIHALICLFIISTASSIVELRFGGVVVSPEIQVALAAWCVLGISIIVGAWVGINGRHDFPLQVYVYYSLVNFLLLCALFFFLIETSTECVTSGDRTAQRVGLSLTCGMTMVLAFVALLAVIAIAAYAIYLCWHLQESLKQEELDEVVRENKDVISSSMKGTMPGRGATMPGRGAGGGGGRGYPLSGVADAADGRGPGAMGYGAAGGRGDSGYGPGGAGDGPGWGGSGPNAPGLGGRSSSTYMGDAEVPGRGYGARLGGGRGEFQGQGADVHLQWAVPGRGQQPAWGSMPIKTTEVVM